MAKPYRRHTPDFKLKICQELRSGALRRRDAMDAYNLSSALIQTWLTQYDRGDPDMMAIDPAVIPEYEARIAALERKIGQLTMELELQKKAPRLRLVRSSEEPSIITGPKVAPSDAPVK